MIKDNHNIYFNTRDELTRVCLDDVMYAASDGNCIMIKYKSGRTQTLLASLQNFVQVTAAVGNVHFERIGRSHVVNTAFVAQVNSSRRTITLVDDDMGMAMEIIAPKEAVRQFKQMVVSGPREEIPEFVAMNSSMEAFRIVGS